MKKNRKIIFGFIGIILLAAVIFLFIFKNNNNKEYTVEFDTVGGNSISSQIIKKGNLVTKPKDPKKIGYDFVEWDYNSKKYNFNTKVTKDMSLIAIWKKVTIYQVQLEVDGQMKAIKVNENKTIDSEDIRDFEKENFTVEWYLNGEKVDLEKLKITKDIKLVGKYIEVPTFSVTFDSNGGTEVENQKINKDKPAKEPMKPTRKGYIFDGWYLDNKLFDFETKITKDINLKAKWIEDKKLKQFTVKFNSNGGSKIAEQIIAKGDKVVKPKNPNKENAIFKEWQLNGKTYDFNTPVIDDITLDAVWNAIIKYTVTFDSNGGSPVESQTINNNGKVNKPQNPTKEGYIFMGWELNGNSYEFNSNVTSNITLTAKWESAGPVIETYFYNTQKENKPENECIALKTNDNKLIVIDTANAKSMSTRQKIKELSGTIDYLIISHAHPDHTDNLPDFLSDPDLNIKNVIYKHESKDQRIKRYLNDAPNTNRNDIDVSTLSDASITYKINDNVTLILFNLQDVFKNYTKAQCGNGINHPSVRFASEINSNYNYYKYNNQYVYLNSLDPNDNTIHFSDAIENIDGAVPNRRYYAYVSYKKTLCNANTNSIAVLVQVKTINGYKYMYIPSDLGNNGYSFFGNERPDLLNSGFRYSKIYATGDEYIYANTFDVNNPSYNDTFMIQNNALVNGDESKLVRVESESLVANQIRNYVGGNLHNIVIYQESHHGFNNAKDAIDTLELNRGGVYSIVTSVDVGLNSPSSRQARGYHYTLSNTTKLATGVSNYGVYCTINNDSTYSCYNKN